MTLLLVTAAWGLPASRSAYAGEFRFVVKDLPDNSAAWLPAEVMVHLGSDLKGGLVFVLANPTARTHVFLAEGLYEQSVGVNGELSKKPLRVTLGPEETIRTVLDIEQFNRAPEKEEPEEFRFYCPLHRSDEDPGGRIRLIHRGGTIHMVQ